MNRFTGVRPISVAAVFRRRSRHGRYMMTTITQYGGTHSYMRFSTDTSLRAFYFSRRASEIKHQNKNAKTGVKLFDYVLSQSVLFYFYFHCAFVQTP